MKYFTLDNWIADQDLDSDSIAAFKAVDDYRAHLASVRDSLPVDFIRMLETVCIHDARLFELEANLTERGVTMRLGAGDIAMREGREVRLHYSGVERMWSTSDPEKGLPGPHGYGDLGNDEIEVLAGGEYEHHSCSRRGLNWRFVFVVSG